MGTSKNQPSPQTPNWRAAQLAYADPSITLDRAVQEIWRAATNQPSGDITESLQDSLVAECFTLASNAPTRETAVDLVARHVASLGRSSIGLVIAQRAIVQSYGKADPVASFASAVFAEAGNYLVSRDLPGFVGTDGRAKTAVEAIALKAAIRDRVTKRASEVRPPRKSALIDSWSDYVGKVVGHLREPRRQR